MMNEVRVSLGELNRLTIKCKDCGAEIGINAADKKQCAIPNQMKCPICTTAFDDKLLNALHTFFDFQTDANESKYSVFFHIRRPTGVKQHDLDA